MKPVHLFARLLLALFLATTAFSAVQFDIPAQSGADALQAFGKQAKVEVSYSAPELRKVTSTAVQGEFEPNAAIEQLLVGTGFTFRQISATNFAVAKVVAGPGAIEGEIREEKSGKPVAGAKVQVGGTAHLATTDKRGRFVIEDVPAGSYSLLVAGEGMQNTKATGVDVTAGNRLSLSPISIPVAVAGTVQLETYSVRAKKNDVIELDPYTVSGRKEQPFTTNMDLPRTINDVQPYVIFDSETIEQSGAINVEAFLKQRLTMNASALSNSQGAGTLASAVLGNTSTVDLRGLGADKTLILVNGRRMPGVRSSAADEAPAQADVNGIPISFIDRIEVLPTSASGIYGASALGGVVNIILKKNYSGGEIRVSYGNTFRSDAPIRSVSASYGRSFEGGKSQLMISASWSDSKPLLFQDRPDLIAGGIGQIMAKNPDFFTLAPFLGSLPNIYQANGSVVPLVLRDGRSLGSNITHLSAGISPTDSVAKVANSLLANAGTYDFNLPPTLQSDTGLIRPLGSSPQNRSLQASFRRKLGPNVELFTDVSYTRNSSFSYWTQLNNSPLTIAANNPNNPFTTSVQIVVPIGNQVTPFNTLSTNTVLTLGALVHLPKEWTVEFDYTYSKSNYSYEGTGLSVAARTAAVTSGQINPFVDTLRYPLDLTPYIWPRLFDGVTTTDDFALRGSGLLLSLPWGAPQFITGIGHRIEATPFSQNTNGGDQSTTTLPTHAQVTDSFPRKRIVNSAYAELQAPLIKRDWLPLVHSLDLQASGRIEDYTVDTGTSYKTTDLVTGAVTYALPRINATTPQFSTANYRPTNYTVGFKYEPVDTVIFRASNGTAFIPPSPFDLIKNATPSTTNTTVQDPKNNNASVAVPTISGGNPDLEPQNSRSLNAGIVWQPKWKPLKGLRFGAEYYWIRQFDAFGTLTAQNIVSLEGLYPDRVTRDASGQITLIDVSRLNLFERSTEGFDLSADYRAKTPLGTFGLHATETIIVHLKQRIAATSPNREYLNFPNRGGAVRLKANATLNWERKQWTAAWTARYFGSYTEINAPGDPVQEFAGSSLLLALGGNPKIPAQYFHDVFLSYSFGKRIGGEKAWQTLGNRLIGDLKIQVGVNNVFNTLPTLDPAYVTNYYLSPFADRRLREYTITLRKQF